MAYQTATQLLIIKEDIMKKVIIGISESGKPYVVHQSRNVQVIFKKQKKRSWKKVIKKWLYHLKQA